MPSLEDEADFDGVGLSDFGGWRRADVSLRYAPLCGIRVCWQALQFDPAASKSVSFTPGLQMKIGS